MLIKIWRGTDALLLTHYPPGISRITVFTKRIKQRILNRYISKHVVRHPNLIKHLDEFGIDTSDVDVKISLIKCTHCDNPCERIDHPGFNIGYYMPNKKKLTKWLYGYDLIEQVIPMFTHVRWIELDGNRDMCDLYPILDMYLRPSRHDGMPRMIMECEFHGIPYYWNPVFAHSVLYIAERIRRVYDQKTVI